MNTDQHRVSIHIYPLSRLVHAPAGKWVRLIKEIEEGKKRAFSYYLPLREAVVLYCSQRGKDYDTVVSQMIRRAHEMGGANGPKMAADNHRAFEVFMANFYPRIRKFERDCLRETQTGTEFDDVKLNGAPHFIATDIRGKMRYVFLLPAEWKQEEISAYLELLAVVVEGNYGGKPNSIWCMDLKSGNDVPFKGSRRTRSKCSDAGRLYAHFLNTMSINEVRGT